jgi:hypothetical protein
MGQNLSNVDERPSTIGHFKAFKPKSETCLPLDFEFSIETKHYVDVRLLRQAY